MKLLFYKWHSFMNRGIEQALRELDIEYDTCFFQQRDWEKDEGLSEVLRNKLKSGDFDAVLSVNFAPIVSTVCEELGVRYISWIYDSPVHIRDFSPMKNSVNEIYSFDRGECEAMAELGIEMRHMPLASDILFASDAEGITPENKISLVGRLYQTDYSYMASPLSDYSRGRLEGIIASQREVTCAYIIPSLVTEELLADLNRDFAKASGGNYEIGRRELMFLLAGEVTGRDRLLAAGLLSKRHPLEIYGGEKDERLTEVSFFPYVDYYEKMPLVFAGSAINLNITLRTIRTGVPLRVMDVLACGGFCITDAGEEVYELFEVGREIETYGSLEELAEKCDYYLSHDTERAAIARAGLAAARARFTFKDRLARMLLAHYNDIRVKSPSTTASLPAGGGKT